MHEQNQIAATLTSAGGTTRLKELLTQVGSASRTEFGRRVRQLFGFHDARGHPQLAGCMKALRALDVDGRIQLPAPRHERRRCWPRGLGRPVPEPQGVPARVDQVQGLELVEVTGDDQRRLWTELLQREHPRGAARHVGAQLRYLLVAEHGVLGALGFAAAALALAARDTCIGWDADLYYARWGIEELFKISKQFLEVDPFHGRTERLVKQELFAHFNLIAMTRSFTNRDAALYQAAGPADGKPPPQANFKHSLAAQSRHLEALLLRHTEFVRATVTRIAACVGIGRRKPRPNRSYPRRSQQPAPKWSRRNPVPA